MRKEGSRARIGLKLAALGVVLIIASSACTSASPTATAPAATSPSPADSAGSPVAAGKGMVVTGVQAMPISANSNAVTVVATIRNGTGRDDRLVGGSSPGAKLGGLYATCGCVPNPTDPETGIVGKTRYPSELVQANETLTLRTGAGELILTGLPTPLAPGDTIEVTFQFETAGAVTVDVPVVASID